MFLGTYPVSVTSGKRVSIPLVFRQELGTDLIIGKWYESCLVLVGVKAWDALLTRITGGEKMIVEPVRGSEHFIFTSAYKAEADAQGRIVLPDSLVSYAALGEQVYFLGVGDRIEIWNKETWEAKDAEVVKNASIYIEQIANDTSKHRSNEEKT